MSVKYFCDSCGTELNAFEHARLKRRRGRVTVEVMHRLDDTWNAGNVCHPCIVKTVYEGHDEV